MPEEAATASTPQHRPRSSIKETLTSIIIAFALAFVFRAFVIEAFIIPTGSMAPTLLGAHMRFQSPASGYSWAVNPWYPPPGTPAPPDPIQGGPNRPIIVNDPMTRVELQDSSGVPARTGDRILVLKYLYSVFDPQRWDVVVFKSPVEPHTNFIKRLVGLPNEELALIDGDVFVRPAPIAKSPGPIAGEWSAEGWTIARKPERIQHALWIDVFDSAYSPPGATTWDPPWVPRSETGTNDWDIRGKTAYTYTGSTPTALYWNILRWPINDFYAYNQTPRGQAAIYPVSDIRLSAGIEGTPARLAPVITTRGHDFRALITTDAAGNGRAALQMRPAREDQSPDDDWQTLGEPAAFSTADYFGRGRVETVDFWHADQALTLYINGSRIAHADYDWSPTERILHTFGRSLERLLDDERSAGTNPFAQPSSYPLPQLRWELTPAGSAPIVMHRVRVQRDIFYQPVDPGSPARGRPFAAHPSTTMLLGKNHFFVCGDNSPASLDARLWSAPDPWVAREIDPATGVVPRDLLIGRAFFVYFPALQQNQRIPVPDFGRMRWIW